MCIVLEHITIKSAPPFSSESATSPNVSPAFSNSLGLIAFNLFEVHAVHKAFGGVEATQLASHLLIYHSVVFNGGFPAHSPISPIVFIVKLLYSPK